jgi:hypothetical protein
MADVMRGYGEAREAEDEEKAGEQPRRGTRQSARVRSRHAQGMS